MPRRAFTLVELLVVISIIGLMSTIAVVSLGSAKVNSRNAARKANLTQLSKALELYYADNGAYPSTGGAWWSITAGWGSSHPSSGASGWIPNLAPTYMAVLPTDPNNGKGNPNSPYSACLSSPLSNAYVYRSDGIDYKVAANCLPEGALSASDPFVDPPRPTYNWAVYTPGAANW